MSRPYIKRLTRNDSRDLFLNLSLSNQYQVTFNSLPSKVTQHLKNKYGIYRADAYMTRSGGLLCSEASLPPSALGTGQTKGDFIGIPQEYAHTRIYTNLSFVFYVDKDYTNLRIFEGWIDYISGGSENDGMDELSDNYYRRMRYPDDYKTSTMYITKFERSGNQRLDYLFVNAFPKSILGVPVSYGGADLIKVGVEFSFDRYILNPKGRIVPNPASNFNPLRNNAELNTVQENKAKSTQPASAPQTAQPIQVVPYTPVENTAGPGTRFLPTDSATGYRGEGTPDGPLLYPNGTPVYRPDGSMRNSQFDP